MTLRTAFTESINRTLTYSLPAFDRVTRSVAARLLRSANYPLERRIIFIALSVQFITLMLEQ